MSAETQTNSGVRTRFLSAGTFEYVQSDSGWEFRPNEDSARRVAAGHSGCVTLIVFVVLVMGGLLAWKWIVTALVGELRSDWLAAVTGIGCAVTLLPLTPLLVACAKRVFAKSLRDNWLTVRVPSGGSLLHGERLLVQPGRAQGVVIGTVEEHDEGGRSNGTS